MSFRACAASSVVAVFALIAVTAVAVPASAQPTPSSNVVWAVQEPSAVTFNNAIAFSPDSSLLATGRTDSNSETLRKARNGALVATLFGAHNHARALAFSPDSTLLAAGTGTSGQGLSLSLWRVSDGVRIAGPVPAHNNGTTGVAFSPDGSTLASCGFHDRTIRMWPIPSLQNPVLIPNFDPALGYDLRVDSIAWSPDGQLLAVGDSRGVKLRLASDGTLIRQIPESGATIVSLAFSPDGQTVAAGVMHQDPVYGTCLDCMVRLWRVEDGTLLQTFRAEEPEFFFPRIGFSPDGAVIGAGGDVGPPGAERGLIQFWDVASGDTVMVDWRPAPVHAFAMAPQDTRYGYVLSSGLVAVARRP
jgi:WD40 repeat protein